MNLIRYRNPESSLWPSFENLSTLREEMNRLLDGSLAGAAGGGGLFGGWSPPLDVSQDKENLYVKVELPGIKKEEIEISYHDGQLTLSGERREEKRDAETFRSERYFGKFHRTVSLPVPVDAQRVKATYRDGILHVELPKADEAKPKQIEVHVS